LAIVGKRRRDACIVRSGFSSFGPAIPQRGWPSANSTSTATQSGSGTTSVFETIT
jgi:hypothetical protein